MALSVETITAISASVVLIIGALAAAIATVINALGHIKQEQATAATRMDNVMKDTELIKGHVNGEKTAIEAREAVLKAENALLKATIADHKQAAALNAQLKAIAVATTKDKE